MVDDGEAPARRVPPRRSRFTPFALAVGLICSGIVSAGTTSTYAAMTASLSNSGDSAGAATLQMQEIDPSGAVSGSCTSHDEQGLTAVCARFDEYGGGTLQPGSGSSVATTRISNAGSAAATSFTLTPGACSTRTNSLGTAGSICDALRISASCAVTTTNGGATTVRRFALLPSGATLTSIAGVTIDLAGIGCTPPPAGSGTSGYTEFTFTVALASSAGTEIQGQTATQSLQWQFRA